MSTVSLVINNKPNVNPETRRRVQAIIRELGYHPQRSARGLASQLSGNIGFILTDAHFSHAEPFYTKIFLGTELEARHHNYYVLLTTVGPTVNKTTEMPRFFLEHNVDGVIIAGKIGASWVEYVHKENIPTLLIDYEIPKLRVSTVTIDNRRGAHLVIEHLLKLGHTQIGFIGGDRHHPSIAARYSTYCDSLREANIAPLESWTSINESGTRVENGYNAAKQLFAGPAGRPSAVFAANDAMALGCMKYFREMKIRVPEDVAIVGFDNVEAGLLVEPRLTTVNVHREEIGSLAVRRLVEMIRDRSDVITRVTTPVELVVRESCGARPAPRLEEVVHAMG